MSLPGNLLRSARSLALLPVRLAFSMTRQGWFVVLVMLMALFVSAKSGRNVPFLLGMVALATLVVSGLVSRRALSGVIVRRGAPERVEAGAAFRVYLSITNAKRIVPAFAMGATESLPAAGIARTPQAFVEAVPAGLTEHASYGLSVRRRGVYRFAFTRLESSFPFGLFRSAAFCVIPTNITVYPSALPVSPAIFEETDRRLDEYRRAARTPFEEDFRGLREYRHGDNPRWIHWRTSARLRKRLVREFERPEAKRITMLLETLINPRALSARRRAHLEIGVRFAASLARECMDRGYDFTFAAFAPGLTEVRVSREFGNYDQLLDCLARLAPSRTAAMDKLLAEVEPAALTDSCVLAVRLGLAGVGEGGAPLEPPRGVPPELFWEMTVGTRDFRALFGRRVEP